MKKLLVGIDRQHAGVPSKKKIGASGAHHDIDLDGKKEVWEQEIFWTAKYGLAIEESLRAMKYFEVMPISDGFYYDRHRRFNEYCMTLGMQGVYLALHCNAGGGDSSIMFYDYRSKRGPKLATSIIEKIKEDVQELGKYSIRAAKPSDWTKNAYYTIRNIGSAVSICCEPFFLDSPAHRVIMNQRGMHRIGTAIALGIRDWWIEENEK
tara:strand:- start:404 stop:1027 length:624 start_codon:yes stop_codon:yes gene_type:complete